MLAKSWKIPVLNSPLLSDYYLADMSLKILSKEVFITSSIPLIIGSLINGIKEDTILDPKSDDLMLKSILSFFKMK